MSNAWFEWAKDAGPSIAVTLTFRSKLDDQWLNQDEAREACRVFCRLLNTRAYGQKFKRGEKRLEMFVILEGGDGIEDKRPHYHLRIEIPSGWTADDWLQAAASEWRKLRWAGTQYRFEDVYSLGWLSYILKLRDKPSFSDAIDVELTHKN